MTSASFAARSSRAAPYAQPQPLEAHYSTGTPNTQNHTRGTNPSFGSDNNILHAHRQNHNSSKLPAFRFADLRKDRISLPSLQQPTPLAPVLSHTTADQSAQSQSSLHHYSSFPERPTSIEVKQTGVPTRTRSLKFDLPSTSTTPIDPSSSGSKRPASFPETPKATSDSSATRSQLPTTGDTPIKRRLTESAIKESAQGQRDFLLPKAIETAKSVDKSRPPISYKLPTTTTTTTNTASNATAAAAAATSSGRAVIPPIRSFRSSGSRKSVVIEMHSQRAFEDSYNEGTAGTNQRDRALRALEGRRDEDYSRLTPSESGEMTTTTDNDNTADIFMKIAREDPAPRASEKQAAGTEPSAIVSSFSNEPLMNPVSAANNLQSRIIRTSHRRPLSTAIPAHDVPSPPRISRRLSDQRENSRARQAAESQPVQQTARDSAYRSTAGRESLPPITTAAEGSSRAQLGRTPQKPSPITPKQISFKDTFGESSSAYQRRRQSLTDNHNLSSSRATQYRNANLAMAQARTYHSSPLVPKSTNVLADGSQHNSPEANNGVEGTESSSSTAAPSTVWDELDDLKSRIHRLERTGKMPSTSGGGMSRSSDDRPRTATTNATTVSASPKHKSGPGSAHADGNSTSQTPREAQPLLLSALSKTKDLVSPEVFSAIELAATDAMALTSMIGAVGQPGPISSSASTIGGYSGSVTDRQLRKKADSICRSLTELCLALADQTGPKKQPQPAPAAPRPEPLLSPTSIHATVGDLTAQRRPSAIADMIAKESTSTRAPTSLEQKRKTMLASISLPTSRYATAPSTPLESTAGRKSSLLLARIRRTGTEEPEEIPQAGRRSSLLLRSRRAGTEEPEEPREGRKTSLLLRTRKAVNEEEDESRARIPSRAITEVNSFGDRSRAAPRDLAMTSTNNQGPAENSPTSSALPRRRLIPSAIATRLSTTGPTASAPTTPARRYLERSTFQDRGLPQERSIHQERGSYLERSTHQERGPVNTAAERLAEERGPQQRQNSLGQTPTLNRTGSLGRRTRESGIPSLRS